jgi:hypothetical protein
MRIINVLRTPNRLSEFGGEHAFLKSSPLSESVGGEHFPGRELARNHRCFQDAGGFLIDRFSSLVFE